MITNYSHTNVQFETDRGQELFATFYMEILVAICGVSNFFPANILNKSRLSFINIWYPKQQGLRGKREISLLKTELAVQWMTLRLSSSTFRQEF